MEHIALYVCMYTNAVASSVTLQLCNVMLCYNIIFIT